MSAIGDIFFCFARMAVLNVSTNPTSVHSSTKCQFSTGLPEPKWLFSIQVSILSTHTDIARNRELQASKPFSYIVRSQNMITPFCRRLLVLFLQKLIGSHHAKLDFTSNRIREKVSPLTRHEFLFLLCPVRFPVISE
jgi:hypothetical protein